MASLWRAFGSRSRLLKTPSGLRGLFSRIGGGSSPLEQKACPLTNFADGPREQKARIFTNASVSTPRGPDKNLPMRLFSRSFHTRPRPKEDTLMEKVRRYYRSLCDVPAVKTLHDNIVRIMEMVHGKLLEKVAGSIAAFISGAFWYWYREGQRKLTSKSDILVIGNDNEKASAADEKDSVAEDEKASAADEKDSVAEDEKASAVSLAALDLEASAAAALEAALEASAAALKAAAQVSTASDPASADKASAASDEKA